MFLFSDHDYCLPETNAIFTRRDELETNLESLKKKNKLLHTTVHNLRKSKSTLETNVNKLKEALKNVKSELSEKAYRTICDILPGDDEDLQLGTPQKKSNFFNASAIKALPPFFKS